VLGDTWSWNGTTWTRLTPATSPPARYAAAMTYDAHTRSVVLYGGASSQISTGSSSNFLDDTWTWDGSTWTQRNRLAHPPALVGGGMVYDAAARNAVLAGGSIPGTPGRSAPVVKSKSTWIWG
jgi:hypothetical protein